MVWTRELSIHTRRVAGIGVASGPSVAPAERANLFSAPCEW